MYRGCGERKMELKGRIISRGVAEGEALTTTQPISFYGGVDPETSEMLEKGHELQGKRIKDKILVFPNGKGSTVGSYTLYRLKKGGLYHGALAWFSLGGKAGERDLAIWEAFYSATGQPADLEPVNAEGKSETGSEAGTPRKTRPPPVPRRERPR